MLRCTTRSICTVVLFVGIMITQTQGQVKTQLDALTGNQRTRIAWVEGGNKLYGGGIIRGYDSQDNTTIQILPASPKQNKPIICSGGYRVVVSQNYKVYVTNWDGTGSPRLVANGSCSDVWTDPATGLEWAVVRQGDSTSAGPVYRYMIDDPAQKKLLWNKTPQGDYYMNWYQISADGMIAVDFLPWDRAFVIDSGAYVTNGFYTNLSRGCWASLASDNSYHWINLPLTGLGHAALNVFRNKDTVITQLPVGITDKKTGTNAECYHPRFASNGGRFVSATAGWMAGVAESDSSEVYVGKFNASYTGFEGWVRITNNKLRDYTPDTWVGVSAPSPSMRLSADTISLTGPQGGASPAAKVDSITTPNGTLQSVTVTDNANWLTTTISQSGAVWMVSNTANSSGLTSGVYRATVTLNAPGAIPTIRTYTVKLTITGTPVPASIRITPASAMVTKSSTVQLSAQVYDQMELVTSPQPAITWSVVAPANNSTVANGLVTAGTTPGLIKIVATTGTVRDTTDVNVVEFIPVDIKVNCGDDSPGYVPGWMGDGQFIPPGQPRSGWLDDQGEVIDMSSVANPPPRDVYVKYRSGNVSYNFPSTLVPPGSYRIRLHYSEKYNDLPPKTPRAINCTAEGTQVMTAMRIFTEAGGVLNKAIVKEYTVSVNNDGLQMQFSGTGVVNQALEIISSGSLTKQITLLEPLGGQTFSVGQAIALRWTGNPSVSGVALEMSPDAGISWYLIADSTISVTDAGWGAYRWVIPPSLQDGSTPIPMVSNEVLFRVRMYTNPAIYDASPAVIKIVPSTAGTKNRHLNAATSQPAVRLTSQGLQVTVPWAGVHTVSIYTPQGRMVQSYRGSGFSHYQMKGIHANGRYLVRIKGEGRVVLRTIVKTR